MMPAPITTTSTCVGNSGLFGTVLTWIGMLQTLLRLLHAAPHRRSAKKPFSHLNSRASDQSARSATRPLHAGGCSRSGPPWRIQAEACSPHAASSEPSDESIAGDHPVAA